MAVAAFIGGVAVVSAIVFSGSGPNDTQRAAAALAPPGRVLHLTARTQQTTVRVDVSLRRSESAPVIAHSEEWSTTSADGTLISRRVVTPGRSANEPPLEDAILVRGAAGATMLLARWERGAGDSAGGTLVIDGEAVAAPLGYGWAQTLRDAYLAGRLGSAGKTLEGDPLFIGAGLAPVDEEAGRPDDCADTELILDPTTLLPRRLTTESGCPISGEVSEVTRLVVDFETFEALPTTAKTNAALRLGPWPVASALEVEDDGALTAIDTSTALARIGDFRTPP